MRVLIGLAAIASLASLANAQSMQLSLPSGPSPSSATNVANGATALATIYIYADSNAPANLINNILNKAQLNSGSVLLNNGNWFVNVAYATTTIVWTVTTNTYTAQSQYRYSGNPVTGGGLTWVCDPCCTGSPNAAAGSLTTCNTQYGPAYNPSGTTQNTITNGNYAGFQCANFQREYTYSGLVVGSGNSFAVQLFDTNANPGPDSVSYSFSITRASPPIIGDPQIYGLQGQDFQVHGIPDEIFNMISYPNLQVNARFVYLSSAECHDNFTACFAHPGTYIGEEGIRLGNDKIHVKAGSYKKGLTVAVNGQRINNGKHSVKLGSVHVMSHRRVIVNTPIMTLTISNSDKFLNQESQLHDSKLLTLGQERRVLQDGEEFHSEVPLHGLQGQTWRNVEYPSGLEYEGSINDYHVVDGNLYGTDFLFNKFQL